MAEGSHGRGEVNMREAAAASLPMAITRPTAPRSPQISGASRRVESHCDCRTCDQASDDMQLRPGPDSDGDDLTSIFAPVVPLRPLRAS